MEVWLDAQLSPALAGWMTARFGIRAHAVRSLGLRDASDGEIYSAARSAAATVMTKDADFVSLLTRFGPPPRILWLTCGNTSNAALRSLLELRWADIVRLFEDGNPLVEVGTIAS